MDFQDEPMQNNSSLDTLRKKFRKAKQMRLQYLLSHAAGRTCIACYVHVRPTFEERPFAAILCVKHPLWHLSARSK
jgi:hypothetical protein